MVATYILYNFILFGSTFFVYLYEKAKDKYFAKFCLFIAFLILFIPAAIRYNIGVDYPSYIDIFYELANGREVNKEIGYVFLNNFVAFFGLEAQWLVILIAFLTYFFLFKGYPKKNIWLINFMFITGIYLYTYSNFRTCLMLSIMYFAIMQYINDKNIFKFVFFLLLSCTLHKTAILFIIIPILYSKMFVNLISKKNLILFFLLVLSIVFVFKNQVAYFMLNNPLVNFLGYSYYSDSSLWGGETGNIATGFGIILRSLPSIIFIIFSLDYIKNNNNLAVFVILHLIYLFCLIMLSAIDIFSRLETIFFIIPHMMAIYFSKFYFSKIKFNIFMIIILVVFFVFFTDRINKHRTDRCDGSRIAPYVTIFNKESYKGIEVGRHICLQQESKKENK